MPFVTVGLPPALERRPERRAVTGLRELYDSRDARSLGPEPTGADLIQLVNQVIDYAIAGLAAVTTGPASYGGSKG